MTDASQAIPYASSTSKQPFRAGRSEREPQMTATVGIGAERIPGHGLDEALWWLAHRMQHVPGEPSTLTEVPDPMSVTASHPARQSVAVLLALAMLLLSSLLMAPQRAAAQGPPEPVRFATFNASLNRNVAGQALSDLSAPFDASEADLALRARRAQAANVAEMIQRVRPRCSSSTSSTSTGRTTRWRTAFQDNYLSVSHNGSEPIDYPYVFVAESNTGIPSGMDLSNDGTVGGPNDAFGFGFFPGQFGMAVFSQHPILTDEVRTFQHFLWKDMPGALLPDDPATAAPADWYSPAELAIFRLSSKSHWDVPIDVGGTTVHFLVSHPTPPVFDDPPFFPAGVDFNGRRNFDEIRLWADYVTPGAGGYIYDDDGVAAA